METKYTVCSYNGILPEDYQQSFTELYEAIYKKDRQNIKKRLLDILKTTLERYPEKPTERDSSTKGVYNAMELLGVNGDMDYGYWLSEVKKVTHPVMWEDNSTLMENLDNPSQIADIIFSIMYYVDPSPSPYTQQQILHALEEYKIGNYEFRISTLLKK